MTRIRIKTDMARREFTIISADKGDGQWLLQSSGMTEIPFTAVTMGEALEAGLQLVMVMKRNPSYQPRQRQPKDATQETSGSAGQPPTSTQNGSAIDVPAILRGERQPEGGLKKPAQKPTKGQAAEVAKA